MFYCYNYIKTIRLLSVTVIKAFSRYLKEDIPQGREKASRTPGKFSASEFRVTELFLLTVHWPACPTRLKECPHGSLLSPKNLLANICYLAQ
jgi:hypothetical protein